MSAALHIKIPLYILYQPGERILGVMNVETDEVWAIRGYGGMMRRIVQQETAPRHPTVQRRGRLDLDSMKARHSAAEIPLVKQAEALLMERPISNTRPATWNPKWQSYADIGHSDWIRKERDIWIWEYASGRLVAELLPSKWAHAKTEFTSGLRAEAKGRVDPATKEGSIWFITNGRLSQRKIVEALVERFPTTKFTVFPEGSEPVGLQQYWEDNLD